MLLPAQVGPIWASIRWHCISCQIGKHSLVAQVGPVSGLDPQLVLHVLFLLFQEFGEVSPDHIGEAKPDQASVCTP